jgi:hypothetical protein
MVFNFNPDLVHNPRDRYAYCALAYLLGKRQGIVNIMSWAGLWWMYYFDRFALCDVFDRDASSRVRSAAFILVQAMGSNNAPLDLVRFNKWRKGIVEILDEVDGGEAILSLDHAGRLIRSARSIKASIRIRKQKKMLWLRIVYKAYKKLEHDPITTMEWYAVSETGRPDEDSIRTLVHGLLEELGITPTLQEMDGLLVDASPTNLSLRPSTAYFDTLSYVLSLGIIVTLITMRPEIEHGADIKDTRVKIRCEWFEEEQTWLPPGNWYARNRWNPDGDTWVQKELVPAGRKILEMLTPEQRLKVEKFESLSGPELKQLLTGSLPPNGHPA